MQLEYRNIKDQNGALAASFVSTLTSALGLSVLVETGTYLGDTLERLRPIFSELYSIELSAEFYEGAKRRFKDHANVHLVHADSSTGLRQVLGKLGAERALIWLDAHYSGGATARGDANTPVFAEVASIRGAVGRRDVVLVDDLRYFWCASPGFLQHEALAGYPAADKLADELSSGTQQYNVFAFSDALLAVPRELASAVEPSPVLQAITQSRLGRFDAVNAEGMERVIAGASGREREAILAIPSYLEGQSSYGLGGHYFYWRALVLTAAGQRDAALSDIDIAERSGVMPTSSIIKRAS